MAGKLVISLDLELLWGIFDKVQASERIIYFENTRKIIPKILNLFEDYGIHATWATVGMLFNRDWEEWQSNIPEIIPDYAKNELSAYEFGEQNKHIISSQLCFASELIDEIYLCDGQEIGTHTYSHYYCLEEGQTLKSFKADLLKCIELAKKRNIELKSLVFPRNQFNQDYLKVCSELGITSVRSNPDNWYWKNTQKDSLQQKIFRTGDAYFGLNDKSYNLSRIRSTKSPVQQPASRLLRPYADNFTEKLKVKRIKNEIKFAAKNQQVYHLWWHPHNFGNNSEQNLKMLEDILQYYRKMKEDFGMESCNMAEITKLIKKKQ